MHSLSYISQSEVTRLIDHSVAEDVDLILSSTVDIMNELIINDHIRFTLGRNNHIYLMDVSSQTVLKDISDAEILQLARHIESFPSATSH